MRCRDRALVTMLACLAATRAAAADPIAPAPASADDPIARELASRLVRLGDYHYRAGHYYRAITAYEELALFATDDAIRVPSAVRIAMSYHHGHQLIDAIAAYDAAIAMVHDPELAQALRVQRAIARAERTFDEPGAEALDAIAAELEPIAAGGPRRAFALSQLARVEGLAGARDRATATIATLAALCVTPTAACDLQPALTRALARPAPSRRSPWLGVAMSAVIPGAGSVYGGHFVDGLYYFGLTSLAGLGAWDVHDGARAWSDQKPTFYALAALGALFYSGGLLSAYVSVARHDEVEALAARRALWRDTDAPLPLEDVAPSP